MMPSLRAFTPPSRDVRAVRDTRAKAGGPMSTARRSALTMPYGAISHELPAQHRHRPDGTPPHPPFTRPRPAPASASPTRPAPRPVPAAPRRASATFSKSVALSAICACSLVSFSEILSSCRSIFCSSFFAARGVGGETASPAAAFAASRGGGRGAAASSIRCRRSRYSSMPRGSIRSARVAEQREHPVGGALDEEPVVGDHDHRAGPAVEQVLQLGQGLDVEVVGGLVEEEDVGLVHQQPQDLEPAPLTAGQVADRRPLLLLGEAELLAQLPGGHLAALAEVDAVAHLLDGLQHPQVRVELGDLLGEVGELDGLADDDPAGGGLRLALACGRPRPAPAAARSCPRR